MAEVSAAAGVAALQRRIRAAEPGGGRFLPPSNLETRLAEEEEGVRQPRPGRIEPSEAKTRAAIAATAFLAHLLAEERGAPGDSATDRATLSKALSAYHAAGAMGRGWGEEDESGVIVGRGPRTLDIRA